MKSLCDANVWIALTLSGHSQGPSAQQWFNSLDTPGDAVFCRATQQSFLRLLSNPTVLGLHKAPPVSNAEAWDTFESLLTDFRVEFRPGEPQGLDPVWRQFSNRPTAAPKLWMDAYLAAFALAGGYRLVTTDGAFRQFEGLDLLVLA